MSKQYRDENGNTWTVIDDDFIVSNMIDVYLQEKGVIIRNVSTGQISITPECISETLDYMFSQRVNDYFNELPISQQESIAKRIEKYLTCNRL
jgi:hypothetical protein